MEVSNDYRFCQQSQELVHLAKAGSVAEYFANFGQFQKLMLDLPLKAYCFEDLKELQGTVMKPNRKFGQYEFFDSLEESKPYLVKLNRTSTILGKLRAQEQLEEQTFNKSILRSVAQKSITARHKGEAAYSQISELIGAIKAYYLNDTTTLCRLLDVPVESHALTVDVIKQKVKLKLQQISMKTNILETLLVVYFQREAYAQCDDFVQFLNKLLNIHSVLANDDIAIDQSPIPLSIKSIEDLFAYESQIDVVLKDFLSVVGNLFEPEQILTSELDFTFKNSVEQIFIDFQGLQLRCADYQEKLVLMIDQSESIKQVQKQLYILQNSKDSLFNLFMKKGIDCSIIGQLLPTQNNEDLYKQFQQLQTDIGAFYEQISNQPIKFEMDDLRFSLEEIQRNFFKTIGEQILAPSLQFSQTIQKINDKISKDLISHQRMPNMYLTLKKQIETYMVTENVFRVIQNMFSAVLSIQQLFGDCLLWSVSIFSNQTEFKSLQHLPSDSLLEFLDQIQETHQISQNFEEKIAYLSTYFIPKLEPQLLNIEQEVLEIIKVAFSSQNFLEQSQQLIEQIKSSMIFQLSKRQQDFELEFLVYLQKELELPISTKNYSNQQIMSQLTVKSTQINCFIDHSFDFKIDSKLFDAFNNIYFICFEMNKLSKLLMSWKKTLLGFFKKTTIQVYRFHVYSQILNAFRHTVCFDQVEEVISDSLNNPGFEAAEMMQFKQFQNYLLITSAAFAQLKALNIWGEFKQIVESGNETSKQWFSQTSQIKNKIVDIMRLIDARLSIQQKMDRIFLIEQKQGQLMLMNNFNAESSMTQLNYINHILDVLNEVQVAQIQVIEKQFHQVNYLEFTHVGLPYLQCINQLNSCFSNFNLYVYQICRCQFEHINLNNMHQSQLSIIRSYNYLNEILQSNQIYGILPQFIHRLQQLQMIVTGGKLSSYFLDLCDQYNLIISSSVASQSVQLNELYAQYLKFHSYYENISQIVFSKSLVGFKFANDDLPQYQKQIYFNFLLCPKGQALNQNNSKQMLNDPYFKLVYSNFKNIKFHNFNLQVEINEILNFKIEEQSFLFNDLYDLLQEQMWYLTAKTTEKVFAHLKELFNAFQKNKGEISQLVEQICSSCSQYQFSLSLLLLINYCKLKIEQMSAKEQRVKAIQAIYSFLKRVLPVCKKIKKNLCIFYISVINNNLKLYEQDLKKVRNPQMLTFSFNDITNNIEICIASKRMPIGYQLNTQKNQLQPIEDIFYIQSAQMVISQLIDYNYAILTTSLEKEQELYTLHRFLSRLVSRRLVYISITDESFEQSLNDVSLFVLNGFLVSISGMNYLSHYHLLKLKLYLDNLQGASFYQSCEKFYNIKIDRYGNRGLVLLNLPTVVADISQNKTLFSSFSSTQIFDSFKMTIDFEKVSSVFANIQCIIIQKLSVEERFLNVTRDYGKQFYSLLTNMSMYKQFFLNLGVQDINLIFSYVNKDKMFDVVVMLLHYILHSQVLIMISDQKDKFIQTIIQLIVASFGLDLIQVSKLQEQAKVLSKIVDFQLQKSNSLEQTYYSYFSKYIYEHFNNDYQIKLYFTNETHQIQYSFLFPIFQIHDIISNDLPLLLVGNVKMLMAMKPYMLITKKVQMLSVYTEQELIQCIRFISSNELPGLICVQPVLDSEIKKCLPHIIALQQFEPYIHDDKGYFSVSTRIKICMVLNFDQVKRNQYVFNYFPRHYLLLSSVENTLASKNILTRQFMNQFRFDIAQYEKIQTPQQDNESCLQLLYIGRDPQERIDQRFKYQTILFCLPHLARAIISHYSEILSQIFQFRYNPQTFLILEQLLLFFSEKQGMIERLPYKFTTIDKVCKNKLQFIKLTRNSGDPFDHFETDQPEISFFENMIFDDVVKYSQKMSKKNLTIQQMLEEIIDYQIERNASSQAIGSSNFLNYNLSISFVVKAIFKPKTYLGSFSSFSLALLVNLWNAYSVLYMVVFQPSFIEMQAKYSKFLDLITQPNQNLASSTATALIKACVYIAYEQGEKISKSVLNYCFENYRTIQQMRKDIPAEQISKYAQKLLNNITRLMPRRLERRYSFIRFDQQSSLKVMFQPLVIGQNILNYIPNTKVIDAKTSSILINDQQLIFDIRRTSISVVLSACLNTASSVMLYGEFTSTGRSTLLKLAHIINGENIEFQPVSFLSDIHLNLKNNYLKQISQQSLYPLSGSNFYKPNHYFNYDISKRKCLLFRKCDDQIYHQSTLIYLQDHVYVFEELDDLKIYSTLATTTDIPCVVLSEDLSFQQFLFDLQINFNITDDIFDTVVASQFSNDLAFDANITKWLIRNCRPNINKSLVSIIMYNRQQQLQLQGSITIKLSLGQNHRDFKIRGNSLIEAYGNERNIMIRALQQTNLLHQSEQFELIQQAEILQQMDGDDEDKKLIQFNDWQNMLLKRLYFEDFDMEVVSYSGSHNSVLILNNIFDNFSERLWGINPFIIFQAYSFALIISNNLVDNSLFVTNIPYPSTFYYNQYIKSIKISLLLHSFNPEKEYKHVIIDINSILSDLYQDGNIQELQQQLKNIIFLALGFIDMTTYPNQQNYKPETVILILDFNYLCYYNFETYQILYNFIIFLNIPAIQCPLFSDKEFKLIQERVEVEEIDFYQCIRKTLSLVLVQSFSNDSAQNFYIKFNFYDLGPVFPTLQIIKEIPIKKYSKVFDQNSQQNYLTIKNIFELSNCLIPQPYEILDVDTLPEQPFQFYFIAVAITTYNTIHKQANYIGCSFQRFWHLFHDIYVAIQKVIVSYLNNLELTMSVTNFYNRQCPLILSCMPMQGIDWEMITREICNSSGKRQIQVECYLLANITYTGMCMSQDFYWFFRYVYLQAAEIALSLVIYWEFLQTEIVTQERMILLLNNYIEQNNKEKQLSQLPHLLVTQIKEQLGYSYEHEKLQMIKSHLNDFYLDLSSFDIFTMLTQNPAILYNIISESQSIIQIPQYNQAQLVASHILMGQRSICTNSHMCDLCIAIITEFVKNIQITADQLLLQMNQLRFYDQIGKQSLPTINIDMQKNLTYEELIQIFKNEVKPGQTSNKYIIIAENFNENTKKHLLKSLLHYQQYNPNYYLVLLSTFQHHQNYINYLQHIDFSTEMIFDHMAFIQPLAKPQPIDHAYNIKYAYTSHMYGYNFIPISLMSKFKYYWFELLQKYNTVQLQIVNLIKWITKSPDMFQQHKSLKNLTLTEDIQILNNSNIRQAFDFIEKTGNEYLDIYMSINTMRPGIFTHYFPTYESPRVDFFKFQKKIDTLYDSIQDIFEIFIFLHKYADHLSQASSFPILMKIYSLNELFSIVKTLLFPQLTNSTMSDDQHGKYILNRTLYYVNEISEFRKVISLSTMNFIQYKISGIFPTSISVPLFQFISMYRVCQTELKGRQINTLKAFMLILQQSKNDFLQSMSSLFLDDIVTNKYDYISDFDEHINISDIAELFTKDLVLIQKIQQFFIIIHSCSKYDKDLVSAASWCYKNPSHFLCLLQQQNIFCTLLSLLDRPLLFEFLKQSPLLLKRLRECPEFKTSLMFDFQDFCLINRKITFINILQLAIFSTAIQMESVLSINEILYNIVNSITNLQSQSIISQKEEQWLEKTRIQLTQTMFVTQIPIPQLQQDNIISQVAKIIYNIEYFLQYGQILHIIYDPNLQPELYLQQTMLQLKLGGIITFIEDMKQIGIKEHKCTYVIKAVNYHHKQQIVQLFEQYHNKYKLVILEQSRDVNFADSVFSLNQFYMSLKDVKGFKMRFLKNLFLLFCYSKSIADLVLQPSCSICVQQLIQFSVNKIQDPDFIELFRTHFHDVNVTQDSSTSVIKQYIQQEIVFIRNSKKNPANTQYTARQIQEDVDSLKATLTTITMSDDDDDEFDDQISDYNEDEEVEQDFVDKQSILKEINEELKQTGSTFLGLIKNKYRQFSQMNEDSVIISVQNLFFPPYRGIVKQPNKTVESTGKFVLKYMKCQISKSDGDLTDFLDQFQYEASMQMNGFRFMFSNSATKQYFNQDESQQNIRILDSVIPEEIQNYLLHQNIMIPLTFSVFCPFLKLSDIITNIPEYICAETVASDYFAIENANCWVVNGVQCYKILTNIFDLLLVKSSIDQMIPIHECQLFFTLKQPLQPVTVNADGSLNLGISGNHNPPFCLLIKGLQLVNGCFDEVLQSVCDNNVESNVGFCQETNIYVSVSKRNEIYSSLVPDNYVEVPIYLFNSTRFSILLPSICGISKDQWAKRKSYIGLFDISQ